MVGLVHTLEHYKRLGLKEVPADLSSTSLPQKWHKPRGEKIRAEPITNIVLAKCSKVRERRPVFATLKDERYVKYIVPIHFQIWEISHAIDIIVCSLKENFTFD